jgi:hypothetical protein
MTPTQGTMNGEYDRLSAADGPRSAAPAVDCAPDDGVRGLRRDE